MESDVQRQRQRTQAMTDDLDRVNASMMLEMPLSYRLRYGQTCTTRCKIHLGCGHTTTTTTGEGGDGDEVQRIMECWVCALSEEQDPPCEPLPGFDEDEEFCPECRIPAEVRVSEEKAREMRVWEEEMRRGREGNDRKREEREGNDRKRDERDRLRKLGSSSASSERLGGKGRGDSHYEAGPS